MRALVTWVLCIVSFLLGVAYHHASPQQATPQPTNRQLTASYFGEGTSRPAGMRAIMANGEELAVCTVGRDLQMNPRMEDCELEGKAHTHRSSECTA
jgi:hypothetical protein